MGHVNAVITYHSLVEAAAPAAEEPRGWQLMTDFQPFALKQASNVHCRTRRMRNTGNG